MASLDEEEELMQIAVEIEAERALRRAAEERHQLELQAERALRLAAEKREADVMLRLQEQQAMTKEQQAMTKEEQAVTKEHVAMAKEQHGLVARLVEKVLGGTP